MVKAMDCGIVAREFKLQLRYYVHFRTNTLGKGMDPFILPAMDYLVHSKRFQTLFVQAFKIVVDSWKFSMLLLYILWDD